MITCTDLQKILDNDEEPLQKRLKMANNAFRSPDLPIQNREAVLLKWLLKRTKGNNKEAWNLLNLWFSSEQMKELNRSNINEHNIALLIDIIPKRLNGSNNLNYDLKSIILDCVLKLLENNLFHQYFKYNLSDYCKFIAGVTERIDEATLFYNFVKGQLFSKQLITDSNFYKHFLEFNLKTLCLTAFKFNENDFVFDEVAKIIQQCLFQKNIKSFSYHLKQYFEQIEEKQKVPLPKAFMKTLASFYNLDDDRAKFVYKLCFQAFVNSFNNDFNLIYKFIVLICETIGFDLQDNFKLVKQMKNPNDQFSLEKSLKILLGVLNILMRKGQCNMECKLNEAIFSEFLENILKSVICSTLAPNVDCFEIIETVISIHPIVLVSVINDIVVYLMTTNIPSEVHYENVLIVVFEVYAKLHRIENLLSKMIRAVHSYLHEDFEYSKGYEFKRINTIERKKSENILVLPEKVLKYFSQCIVSLASWQVINLFKTLLFHLDSAVKEDLPNVEEVDLKLLYIEFLSTLTCCFLSSVRIAEHTTPTLVIDKFVVVLNDFTKTLNTFGQTLLNREHNQILMRSYLNICYVWAEVYMNLSYYSINSEIQMKRAVDSDYSACNIRYLHSYLSTEQWCLISQRITNFGETRCKQIMQNLFLQKVRAMLIFEDDINNDVLMSVVKSISSNIEISWMDMISDSFVMKNILTYMDQKCIFIIVEHVLEEVLKDDNLDILKKSKICDSPLLTDCLLYLTMSKINKLFKPKRKQNDSIGQKLSAKVFSTLPEETFLNGQIDCMISVSKVIENCFIENETNLSEVDEDKLNKYLNLIQTVPVIYCKPDMKMFCMFYILALIIDLKQNKTVNKETKLKCENLIIGSLHHNPETFIRCIEIKTLIRIIAHCFIQYEEVFYCVVDSVFKSEDLIKAFKPTLVILTDKLEEEKYLEFSLIVLSSMNKHKKTKNSENRSLMLEYKNAIYEGYIKLINRDDEILDHSFEAYAIVLRNCFSLNEEEHLSILLPHLQMYIRVASKLINCKIRACLIFYTTILMYKSKLDNIIKDNFVTEVWNNCKNLKVNSKDEEEFSQLIALVFEHVPNEDFEEICKDLYSLTASSLSTNNLEDFRKYLKMWNSVLHCNFNATKTQVWQEYLNIFLQKLVEELCNENFKEMSVYMDIVQFENNIINRTLFTLTPTMLDLFFITISNLMDKSNADFVHLFSLCMSIMDALWRFRKPLLLDRLPPYLQQYRVLLKYLCIQSNSDLNLEAVKVQEISNCAHKMERLTNALVGSNKHLARISPYLIADILHKYEQFTLYPNVKIHLNHCLYSLMSLCDQHSVSYSMRVLSPASTELFKVMYENYKKYYKFTGKI